MNSYEEFEKGINIEFDGVNSIFLDCPKNFDTHSNVRKMKCKE